MSATGKTHFVGRCPDCGAAVFATQQEVRQERYQCLTCNRVFGPADISDFDEQEIEIP